MDSTLELLPAYREWLTRLDMTYQSVVHCCSYRLRDQSLAERAGLGVLTGLLAKPKVFQYFGLPYSGRIAHLAEAEIARLSAEDRTAVQASPALQQWYRIWEALAVIPADLQAPFVLACVDGYDGQSLAAALGCDEQEAATRLGAALRLIQDITNDKALCRPTRA
jgi:DNA-directed RNA polymerase specialized sigma24 family protein